MAKIPNRQRRTLSKAPLLGQRRRKAATTPRRQNLTPFYLRAYYTRKISGVYVHFRIGLTISLVLAIGGIILVMVGFASSTGHSQPLALLAVKTDQTQASTASSISLDVSVPKGLQLQPDFPLFGSFAITAPAQWQFADGSAIPIGLVVGNLSGSIQTAQGAGGCSNPVEFNMPLYNSVLDGQPASPGQQAFDANADGIPDGVTQIPTEYANVTLPGPPQMRLFGASRATDRTPIYLDIVISTLPDQRHRLDFLILDQSFNQRYPNLSQICSPIDTKLTLLGTVQDPTDTARQAFNALVNPESAGTYPWELSIQGADYSANATVSLDIGSAGNSVALPARLSTPKEYHSPSLADIPPEYVPPSSPACPKDWQSFSSTKLDFSFCYPKGWTMNETSAALYKDGKPDYFLHITPESEKGVSEGPLDQVVIYGLVDLGRPRQLFSYCPKDLGVTVSQRPFWLCIIQSRQNDTTGVLDSPIGGPEQLLYTHDLQSGDLTSFSIYIEVTSTDPAIRSKLFGIRDSLQVRLP